jgi:transcription antitermination factor NusB
VSDKEEVSASRRRGREVALQVLYAMDVARDRPRRESFGPTSEEAGSEANDALLAVRALDAAAILGMTPEAVFESIANNFEMPLGTRDFARDLVERVRTNLPDLDEAITLQARNWRMSRMAVVDRNILRLGTYELVHTETPAPVILNEAVELARRFSNDPSPAFVNGILDAVARTVRGLEA